MNLHLSKLKKKRTHLKNKRKRTPKWRSLMLKTLRTAVRSQSRLSHLRQNLQLLAKVKFLKLRLKIYQRGNLLAKIHKFLNIKKLLLQLKEEMQLI